MGYLAFGLVLCCALLCHSCRNPTVPGNIDVFFASHPRKSGKTNLGEGTIATYFCSEQYYELLGPREAICQHNGSWSPNATPFCLANVATKKAAFQSSRHSILNGPSFAVDGKLETCVQTRRQRDPWWYVDLQGIFPVTVLKIDFGAYSSLPDTSATVRVGNNSEDLRLNPVCGASGGVSKSKTSYTYLFCPSAMFGRYVSLQLQGLSTLSFCEVAVYSDVRIPGTSEPASTTEIVVATPAAEHGPTRKALAGICVAIAISALSAVFYYTWRKSRRCFVPCCRKENPVLTREFTGETNLAFDYVTERNLERGYRVAWEEVARHGAAALATATPAKTVRDASTMTWTPPSVSDISMGHI